MKSNYIPKIDGLRAIEVIMVLLFHLDPEFLKGGIRWGRRLLCDFGIRYYKFSYAALRRLCFAEPVFE